MSRLRATNRGEQVLTVHVKDHGYRSGDHTIAIEAGGRRTVVMPLGQSHHWYDFSVTIAGADQFSPLCGAGRDRQGRH